MNQGDALPLLLFIFVLEEGAQIPDASSTKFCAVWGSSAWKLLHVAVLADRISRWLLGMWKIFIKKIGVTGDGLKLNGKHQLPPWFEASAAKQTRTVLSWVITQRVMVIPYQRFGTTYGSHLYGIENLSRNVSKKLPLFVASRSRRSQSLSASCFAGDDNILDGSIYIIKRNTEAF
jgi:hypothetical protein